MSYDNGNPLNCGDAPHAWCYTQPLISDMRPPPQPFNHDRYDTIDDCYEHVPLFRDAYEPDSSTASAESEPNLIGQLTLAQELDLLGQGNGDWAKEVEMEMGFDTQGEYMAPSYSPPPAPPSPASW